MTQNSTNISNQLSAMIVSCLLLIIHCTSLSGQIKYEHEFGVSADVLPTKMTKALASCNFKLVPNYYKEVSQDGPTFEAKFKLEKRQWSIEFDTLGQWLDAELLYDWEKIPKSTRNLILKSRIFEDSKYKIEKLQLQFLPQDVSLCDVIQDENPIENNHHYEIVVHIRKDQWKKYEVLFAADGALIKMLTIQQRPTDNMDF